MPREPIKRKYKYEDYKEEILLRDGIDPDLKPYKVKLPKALPYHEFVNYGLPKEKQFWQYEVIPDWVNKLNKIDRAKAIDKAESTPEYADWIEDQWRKRREGIFIFIKGRPFWIPPKYWFFLNYGKVEGGKPIFKVSDWEEYVWVQKCVLEDGLVDGGIIITMRRDGKSVKRGVDAVGDATSIRYANIGMMSHNEEASRKLFRNRTIPTWKGLPFYFSAKFSNRSDPVNALVFKAPAKGGTLDVSDLLGHEEDEDMNSSIMVSATKVTAFDGERLGGTSYKNRCIGIIFDECAKWEEIDVNDTWDVHRHCLRIGLKKVGKAIFTTTVEEATPKGLKRFIRLVGASMIKDDMSMGATESGLIVYFKPAHESLTCDKYGFPIMEDPTPEQSEGMKEQFLDEGYDAWVEKGYHLLSPKRLLQLEAEAIDDPRKRRSFLRRYPPSLKAALSPIGKTAAFKSIDQIEKSLLRFSYGNRFSVHFDLEDNGEGGYKAVIRETGRFQAPQEFLDFWDASGFANNVRVNDQQFLVPQNDAFGMISADPFKYTETDGSKQSKGTLTAFMNYLAAIDGKKQAEIDWITDDWVVHYSNRVRTPDEYCVDARKICFWLGMKIMPENNIDYIRQDFSREGFAKFLEFRTIITEVKGLVIAKRAATAGVQTSGGSEREAVMMQTDSHLMKHAMRCKFQDILEDCRDLDPDDWSPTDSFVTAGRSCYYAKQVIRPKRQAPKEESFVGQKGFTGHRVRRV